MHQNFKKLSGIWRAPRGFTLIELAIVLGIFGIIIASVFVLVSNAMQSQRDNRMSQEVITTIENIRNYARHVDNYTFSLENNGNDACQLGLLSKDIIDASGNCTGPYTNALGGSIAVCAEGTAHTTECGSPPATASSIAIVASGLMPADCAAVIGNLSGGNVSDLGFSRYFVNSGTPYATSNTANLSLIGLASNCGSSAVTLELDFSL